MKRYQPLTLNDLIIELRCLPKDTLVRGLDGNVHSYRGFYDRSATRPTTLTTYRASELAAWYTSEVDTIMHGWKGGDFTVDGEKLIYYADIGETGPCILGLEPNDQGVYELVLLDDPNYLLY